MKNDVCLSDTASGKPAWVRTAVREVDVSDAWNELRHPDSESGDECIAYLSSNVPMACFPLTGGPDPRDGLTLDGFRIRDGADEVFWDRARIVRVLGMDLIWRIEQHEMEAA